MNFTFGPAAGGAVTRPSAKVFLKTAGSGPGSDFGAVCRGALPADYETFPMTEEEAAAAVTAITEDSINWPKKYQAWMKSRLEKVLHLLTPHTAHRIKRVIRRTRPG